MKKVAGHWLAAVIADVDAEMSEGDFRWFVAWILLDPVAAEVRSLLVEKLGVEVADFGFEDDLERFDGTGLHRFCQDTDINRLRQLLGSAKFIRLANERLQSDFLPEPQVQLSEQSTWGMELAEDHTIAAATNEELSDLNDRCHDRLVAYAFRLCGDWQLAEDIVQGVFVRIMCSKPESPKHLENIAYQAIQHELVDKMRRRAFTEKPGVEFAEFDATPFWGCEAVEPPRILERLEVIEAVQKAISLLPDKLRKVLCLDLNGMPVKEIATVLDIPQGTVGSRLSLARMALADNETLLELVGDQ